MHSDPRGDRDGSPRRLCVEFEPWHPPGDANAFVFIGPLPPTLVGVTGLDADDCRQLVRAALGDRPAREVRQEMWDVDVGTMGAGRVLTGNPAERGIWYCGP